MLKIIAFMEIFDPDKGLMVKTQSQRLWLQSVVYFLQEFGASISYRFDWYNFGPYSVDLCTLAYELKELIENEDIVKIARKKIIEDKKAIQNLKEFLNGIIFLPKINTSKEEKMKLLASLCFLTPKGLTNEYKEKIEMRMKKPLLQLNSYDEYWKYLKKHGLCHF